MPERIDAFTRLQQMKSEGMDLGDIYDTLRIRDGYSFEEVGEAFGKNKQLEDQAALGQAQEPQSSITTQESSAPSSSPQIPPIYSQEQEQKRTGFFRDIAAMVPRVPAATVAGFLSGIGKPSPALEKFSRVPFSTGTPGQIAQGLLGRAVDTAVLGLELLSGGAASTLAKTNLRQLITKPALTAATKLGIGGGLVFGTTEFGREIGEGEKISGTKIGKSFAVGAITFPLVAYLTGALSRAWRSLGDKIQTSSIQPTRADYESGFDVKNIQKYKVGGTLRQTGNNVEKKIISARKELAEKIGNKEINVNINEIFSDAENKLFVKQKGFTAPERLKLKAFMDNQKMNILDAYPDGQIPLQEFQDLKTTWGRRAAAGGGFKDFDTSVATQGYTQLSFAARSKIIKTEPAIEAIYKKLHDLSPIEEALIRRLPVLQRQAIVNQFDIMSGIIGTGIRTAVGGTKPEIALGGLIATAASAGGRRILRSQLVGSGISRTGTILQKLFTNPGVQTFLQSALRKYQERNPLQREIK